MHALQCTKFLHWEIQIAPARTTLALGEAGVSVPFVGYGTNGRYAGSQMII